MADTYVERLKAIEGKRRRREPLNVFDMAALGGPESYKAMIAIDTAREHLRIAAVDLGNGDEVGVKQQLEAAAVQIGRAQNPGG